MIARLALIALLALPAGSAVAQTDGQAATITLGEIRVPDAIVLKDRLLPAAIAAKVEAGRIVRQWLPGEAHRATFREPPREGSDRLCTMAVHSVTLSDGGPLAPRGLGEALPLTIGPLESGETFAVRPAGSEAPCTPDLPYVYRQQGLAGELQEAAYRRVLEWIDRARGGSDPGVALECNSEQPMDCADPRAALAALPLETLLDIHVVNPRHVVQSDLGNVRVLVAQPLARDEPYEVTVALGMSGEDGRSWRLTWTEGGGDLSPVRMRRSTITYH